MSSRLRRGTSGHISIEGPASTLVERLVAGLMDGRVVEWLGWGSCWKPVWLLHPGWDTTTLYD